jgi:hypothetical protein
MNYKGNLAIRDHINNSKDLHLFKYVKKDRDRGVA